MATALPTCTWLLKAPSSQTAPALNQPNHNTVVQGFVAKKYTQHTGGFEIEVFFNVTPSHWETLHRVFLCKMPVSVTCSTTRKASEPERSGNKAGRIQGILVLTLGECSGHWGFWLCR